MTLSSPTISVAISSYNFGRFLPECIDSVLSQTLQPYEIIISDDCSTDDSWSIISDYASQFPKLIKAFSQKENVGTPINRNFNLKESKGDLVVWMDGDDRWDHQLLEIQWNYLKQNPWAAGSYSNVRTIDEYGKEKRTFFVGTDSIPPSGDLFVPVFSRRVFSSTRSVFRNHLVRRDALETAGYYDEELETLWDWDSKIRFTNIYPMVYTGELLVDYRHHDGGYSRRYRSKIPRTHIEIYEKNQGLLDSHSLEDFARVQCNIEPLIALWQLRENEYPSFPKYSAANVYKRCSQTLGCLKESSRTSLLKEVSPELRMLALRAVQEEIYAGRINKAKEFWRGFEQLGIGSHVLRDMVAVLVPYKVTNALRRITKIIKDWI